MFPLVVPVASGDTVADIGETTGFGTTNHMVHLTRDSRHTASGMKATFPHGLQHIHATHR